MQITLYMAPSLDGYIATSSGDSEWVSDVCAEEFMKTIHDYGCIIYGHNTYTQFQGELYPVAGVTNIVLTTDVHNGDELTDFVSSPAEAVERAQAKGHKRALLIGGGTTNGNFLDAGLITDMILDYHPIILGSGIRLFGNSTKRLNASRTGFREMGDGLIHTTYTVTY